MFSKEQVINDINRGEPMAVEGGCGPEPRTCSGCNLSREVAMADWSRILVCDGGCDELEQVESCDPACDKYEPNLMRLILRLDPEFWFVENPRAAMRRMPWMGGLPRYTVPIASTASRT